LKGVIMAVTTFNFDEKLNQTLERLKEHYHAGSKAEVLRKAIALLNVASRNEEEDGSLVIRHNGKDIRVLMK
jgi:hypothetical protein